MALALGTRLGAYDIIGLIGAGGFGEVYKARDPRLDRTIAIKILPSADPELKARFRLEARAVAALAHPHICTLYDVGDHDGFDYLVMEYLEGETLDTRIARGRIQVDEAVKIAVQIADALATAHREGIVHRDLKPANVMLTRNGVKLLDFGLAKLRRPGVLSGLSIAATAVPLTASGSIVGTLQYMAPEQLEGKDVDERVDVFSFGAVLYEMVTGRRAFEGQTPASVIAAVLDRAPRRVTEVVPDLPRALDDLVGDCLAKDPNDRWRSLHDARLQLQRITRIVPAMAPPRRLTAALGAAFAVVIAAGVAVWYRPPNSVSEPERVVFSVVPPADVLTAPGTGVTPDGKYIVRIFNDPKDGVGTLWTRALDATTFRRVPGTERASSIFYSPDSTRLGFNDQRLLKTARFDGGPVTTLAEVRASRGGSWSQRGVIVFAPDDRGPLWSVSAEGGPSAALTRLDPARAETSHRFPYFLPDGNHFVFLVRSDRQDTTGLAVSSLDNPAQHSFVTASDSDASFARGRLLFVRQGNLLAQRFDANTLSLQGEAETVATEVDYVPATGRASFGTSVTGSVLTYFSARRGMTRLVWFGPQGDQLPAASQDGYYSDFRVMPDDRRVVFTRRQRPDATTVDLWMWDLPRQNETRVAGGLDSRARILRTTGTDVWLGVPDGAETVARRFDVRGIGEPEDVARVEGVPIWDVSADGKDIVFGRSGDLWLRQGGRSDRLLIHTAGRLVNAAFSPDGAWVAYISNETGRDELYARDTAGAAGRVRLTTGGATDACWGPDGSRLYYRTLDGGIWSIAVTGTGDRRAFAAGSRRFFAPLPFTFANRTHAIAADGRLALNVLADDVAARSSMVVLNWTAPLKK